MSDPKPLSGFQTSAFQTNAFQIFDEATIDDGITTTMVRNTFITSSLAKLPGDNLVTTARPNNRQITA